MTPDEDRLWFAVVASVVDKEWARLNPGRTIDMGPPHHPVSDRALDTAEDIAYRVVNRLRSFNNISEQVERRQRMNPTPLVVNGVFNPSFVDAATAKKLRDNGFIPVLNVDRAIRLNPITDEQA
jgi:hypothetical protein